VTVTLRIMESPLSSAAFTEELAIRLGRAAKLWGA